MGDACVGHDEVDQVTDEAEGLQRQVKGSLAAAGPKDVGDNNYHLWGKKEGRVGRRGQRRGGDSGEERLGKTSGGRGRTWG